MDIRHIRQFIAVAEELSYRRAADRLHMSQPPLSAAIQKLEGELGVVLLLRDRQGVRLTPAGAAFLSEIKRVLDQQERAIEIAQRVAAGRLGTLKLSFFPSAAFRLVPELLASFRESYPDVEILLSTAPSSLQNRPLLNGSVDVGIVVPAAFDAQGLRLQALSNEELALAVPAGHALSTQAVIPLKDLSQERFVGLDTRNDPAFENLIITTCQQSGFSPRVRQRAPDIMAVLSLVGAGMGIALVPSSMKFVHISQVTFVKVHNNGNPLRYPIALAYDPDNQNPILPAFLSMGSRRLSPWPL